MFARYGSSNLRKILPIIVPKTKKLKEPEFRYCVGCNRNIQDINYCPYDEKIDNSAIYPNEKVPLCMESKKV